MAWSGERWIADPSPLLGHKAEARIPRLPTCLSVLFLGCNLDATEETNNKDPSLSIYLKIIPFLHCVLTVIIMSINEN